MRDLRVKLKTVAQHGLLHGKPLPFLCTPHTGVKGCLPPALMDSHDQT